MVSVEIDSVSVFRMGETPARKRTKSREGTNWSLITSTVEGNEVCRVEIRNRGMFITGSEVGSHWVFNFNDHCQVRSLDYPVRAQRAAGVE